MSIEAIKLVVMPEPPPELQTEAEKTAYAFGWWKALESVRAEKQEPVQVTIKDFVAAVEGKEDFVGRPVYWAQWPNKDDKGEQA
jgi:hypothetical protein